MGQDLTQGAFPTIGPPTLLEPGTIAGHLGFAVAVGPTPKNVHAKAISLEDAPKGYAEFDAGAATKYVLNPNGYLS